MSLPVLIAAWPAWLVTAVPWVALGLTTVAFIAAFRTRWRRAPILTRCVVLSIYAHLLFATIAYTTNFVAWRPGLPGSGGGVREVRVRMAEESSPTDHPTEPAIPWEPKAEVPLELAPAPSRAVAPGKATTAEQAKLAGEDLPQLPELPPAKLPSKSPAPSPLESVAEVLAEVAPRYAERVQPSSREPIETSQAEPPTSPIREPISSRPSSTPLRESSIPELYQLRFDDHRSGIIEAAGGNADTEAAVQSALAWLIANQERKGHWSAARHGAGRGSVQQGQDRGETGADADTGITALAVLALMGAGNTHLQGEHRVAVQHSLEFLLASQRSDGCLAGNARLFASTYCHGMSLLALSEALAISRDQRLRPAVERAVRYTVTAQHSGGGWRYQPQDVGDMSQFGWQIMALKSADLAGIRVPELTRQRANHFLVSMSSGRHGGLASYRARERASRTMTAEALLCRYLLEESPQPETSGEAIAFILQEPPSSRAANVYYWYYGTLAMRFSGGEAWQRWNNALQPALLHTQQPDGSWEADSVWGGYGGKVYQTALSALCLQAYYRYDANALSTSASGNQ